MRVDTPTSVGSWWAPAVPALAVGVLATWLPPGEGRWLVNG